MSGNHLERFHCSLQHLGFSSSVLNGHNKSKGASNFWPSSDLTNETQQLFEAVLTEGLNVSLSGRSSSQQASQLSACVCCVFLAACCLDSAPMLLGNSTKSITRSRAVAFVMFAAPPPGEECLTLAGR